MTKLMLKVLRDCTKKTARRVPTENDKAALFALTVLLDRAGELAEKEGLASLQLAIRNRKGKSKGEEFFIKGLQKYFQRMEPDKIANELATDYFMQDPQGWDAVGCFMGIWAATQYVQENGSSFLVLDESLEYLLPEDMQWDLIRRKRDWTEDEAEEKEEDHEIRITTVKEEVLGEAEKWRMHRFDDIILKHSWQPEAETAELADRVGQRLVSFGDGAAQDILKTMSLKTTGLVARALSDEAYDFLCSNVEDAAVCVWKRDMLLGEGKTEEEDVIRALKRLEKAMDSYKGDPQKPAEYY